MISSNKKLKVTDLNPFLICVLCKGYYIDATTIVECLHSFCKTCIVKYLKRHKYCPICDVLVYKTKPLQNIRSDQRLQNVVYKLIPGLYEREMQRRQLFFSSTPPEGTLGLTGEEKGIITESADIILPDENISITLEYLAHSADDMNKAIYGRRYLRCKASAPVSILHKFLRNKFSLSNKHCVELVCNNEPLTGHMSVMDVAYIYQWKKQTPMYLGYRILETKIKRICEKEAEEENSKRLKLSEELSSDVAHPLPGSIANSVEASETNTAKSDSNSYLSGPVKPESSALNKRPLCVNSLSRPLQSHEWKEVELKINDNGEMRATPITSQCSLSPSNTLLNLTSQSKPYTHLANASLSLDNHLLPSSTQLTNFLATTTTFASLMPRPSYVPLESKNSSQASKYEITVNAVALGQSGVGSSGPAPGTNVGVKGLQTGNVGNIVTGNGSLGLHSSGGITLLAGNNLGSTSVTWNSIVGANLSVGGTNSVGNMSLGENNTVGNVSVTGNNTAMNTSVAGNNTAGNISTAGNITAKEIALVSGNKSAGVSTSGNTVGIYSSVSGNTMARSNSSTGNNSVGIYTSVSGNTMTGVNTCVSGHLTGLNTSIGGNASVSGQHTGVYTSIGGNTSVGGNNIAGIITSIGGNTSVSGNTIAGINTSIGGNTSVSANNIVGVNTSMAVNTSLAGMNSVAGNISIVGVNAMDGITPGVAKSIPGSTPCSVNSAVVSNRALVYPMIQEPRTPMTYSPGLKLTPSPRVSRPRGPSQPRYKTLKTGVQPWNPTVSRSKVSVGSCDPLKPQEMVSKIFKSRNTRFSSPSPPTIPKATGTLEAPKPRPAHSTVTKVDPRTLSPIVPASSTATSKSDSPTYISSPSSPSHLSSDKHKYPRPNPFLRPSFFYPGFLPYAPDTNPLLPNSHPDFFKAMSALYQQNPAFHSSLPPSISTLFNHHLPSQNEKKSSGNSSPRSPAQSVANRSSPLSSASDHSRSSPNHIYSLSNLSSSLAVSPTAPSSHHLPPSLKSYIPLNSISNSKAASSVNKTFSPVKSSSPGGKDKSPTSVNSIFSPVNMISSSSSSRKSYSPSPPVSSVGSASSTACVSSQQPLSLVTTPSVTTSLTTVNDAKKDSTKESAKESSEPKVTPVVSSSQTNSTTSSISNTTTPSTKRETVSTTNTTNTATTTTTTTTTKTENTVKNSLTEVKNVDLSIGKKEISCDSKKGLCDSPKNNILTNGENNNHLKTTSSIANAQ